MKPYCSQLSQAIQCSILAVCSFQRAPHIQQEVVLEVVVFIEVVLEVVVFIEVVLEVV